MELTTLSIVTNTSDASVHDVGDNSDAAGASPREVYELKWVTVHVLSIIGIVVKIGFNGVLCLLGVINNIITIIVFSKMGFKETTNISMTAIACWDLLKSLVYGGLLGRPLSMWVLTNTNRDIMQWYHGIANRALSQLTDITTNTSSMLAVYVAIERCLCVSMPFTVKFLLTRKTAIVSCLAISAIVFGSYTYQFFMYRLRLFPFSPSYTGRKFLISFPTSFGSKIYNMDGTISYTLNSCYPIAALCVMTVCTAIIVNHLKKSSKFRTKNAKDESGQLSSRERRITKMLIVIIIFYMIYLVPWLVYYLVPQLIPFPIKNLDQLVKPFMIFFSLINSSVNLYIFYFMSSGFKRTLRKMFHLSEETTPASTN